MNNDHVHSATAKFETANINFASYFAKPPNKISRQYFHSYTVVDINAVSSIHGTVGHVVSSWQTLQVAMHALVCFGILY